MSLTEKLRFLRGEFNFQKVARKVTQFVSRQGLFYGYVVFIWMDFLKPKSPNISNHYLLDDVSHMKPNALRGCLDASGNEQKC